VELLAFFGGVIGGDRLDRDLVEHRLLAIGQCIRLGLQRLGKHVENGRIGKDLRVFAHHSGQCFGVIVIAVLVGDQDQIGGGKIAVIGDVAHGIAVDHAGWRLHHKGRVVDGVHFDLAAGHGEHITTVRRGLRGIRQ